VRVKVIETRPPSYIRTESAGEDSGFANSFKQSSEVFLFSTDVDTTEMRVRVNVKIFGRLGVIGFNVIETKMDQLWAEFGENLSRHFALKSY
jgi:carbon monoxide dehydrogenase subunit G